MKTTFLTALAFALLLSLPVHAGTERIDDGGQEIDLDLVVPHNEAGILVFYASWDTPSTTLVDEIESWATTFVGLNLVFVDITDLRTQVCRQFEITEIPSIIVVDDDHERVGEVMDNTTDLEELLSDEGII